MGQAIGMLMLLAPKSLCEETPENSVSRQSQGLAASRGRGLSASETTPTPPSPTPCLSRRFSLNIDAPVVGLTIGGGSVYRRSNCWLSSRFL